MITVLGAIISGVGSAVSGFFGFKAEQSKNISEALKVINDINSSAADKEKAIAGVVIAEASSSSWLASSWRPLLMVVLSIMVIAYFLGFTTPNLLIPMPENSAIAKLFDLLMIGVMGYMPLRSFDKLVQQLNIGKVLQTFIDKKLG
jgi:hypothetical protein